VEGRTYQSKLQASWSALEDVLAAVEAAPAPIIVRMRRGGPEPWSLDRDGRGLSVDEMVEATKSTYSRLIDSEKEEALRSAFGVIKEAERKQAAEAAAAAGYESEALKSVSKLNFELRSFAQGARDALEQLGQTILNRALLDSRLAVQTAEYLLRRALLDTGRVLSASSVAVGILSGSSVQTETARSRALGASGTMSGGAAPYASLLDSLSSRYVDCH
jgi:hypothetical protein